MEPDNSRGLRRAYTVKHGVQNENRTIYDQNRMLVDFRGIIMCESCECKTASYSTIREDIADRELEFIRFSR
jgi:hypothetical protein